MYCQKCGTKLDKNEGDQTLIEEIAKFKEAVVNYKKEVADYNQDVYAAAHRMYRDWQSSRKRTEAEMIRTVIREECESILESILEGKKKATFFPKDRKGEKWTETEDDTLKKKLCSFLTRAAKEHRRSYGAISSRIRRFYVQELR